MAEGTVGLPGREVIMGKCSDSFCSRLAMYLRITARLVEASGQQASEAASVST